MKKVMVRRLFLLIPIFALLTAEACAPASQTTQPPSRGSAGSIGYDEFFEHLRSSGLKVESLGEVEQPFFTRKARVVRIGTTGEAQVYEYATEDEAMSDAAKVSANGSIGGSMPMWVAAPHFFRRRNLIVLYLGSDENTLLNLRGLLGTEFAGQR